MTEFIKNHPVALNTPFNEKDQAKALGARWMNKAWAVPTGKDLVPFKKWLMEPELSEVREHLGEEAEQGMTLQQLMGQVKRMFDQYMADSYWVRAEIMHVQNNNHMYLELSDYDTEGKQGAKARAMIWSNQLDMIRKFEAHTGSKIQPGMKVLLQVTVEYHPQFGMSLQVQNIDFKFTLGDMEARLKEIRDTLTAEGIFNLNRNMALPFDFTRVAVIAPKSAAGLGDFRTQADALAYHNLCEFHYYDANYQGQNAIESISAAFSSILNKQDQYDCIVMIRGGGDKAGLYELNRLELARMVCKSSLPVIVGIGHERDNTVIDELACMRCATPSIVVGHIAGTIVGNYRNAESNMAKIKQGTTQLLNMSELSINNMLADVRFNAEKTVAEQDALIDQMMQSIKISQARALDKAEANIKMMMGDVLNRDPLKILDQGYTYTRASNGHVLTTAEQAKQEAEVIVRFKDGEVRFCSQN